VADRDAAADAAADAAEANLVVHIRWVQERAPGMRVDDTPDLLVVDSGLPSDTFNFAARARLDPARLDARIAEVRDRFRTAGRPFSWWMGAADRPARLGEALRRAGFEAAESEVAMAADLDALVEPPVPAGLRVERARTPAQLDDFAAVLAANWSPPDPSVARFYAAAAPYLLASGSPLRLYVGYLDDEPVASAELTVGGGVVGLYNIATIERRRGRGIGSAITAHPLLDARAEGHRTGILQASADGLNVYARLGFRPTGHYTEYKPA
jgi:GNAT superfamily N-acetyltransferase